MQNLDRITLTQDADIRKVDTNFVKVKGAIDTAESDISDLENSKQNKLTAGSGININGNTISSDVIDDSVGASDTGANKKTYSIVKISNLLTSAMKYQGQVVTYNDLPNNLTVDNVGYLYNVVDTGDNYAWNGTGWDNMAGEYVAGTGIVINGKTISCNIDISGKQDKLTAGTGISISSANVISSSIDVSGKQDKLTAGTGISISSANVISSNIDVSDKLDKRITTNLRAYTHNGSTQSDMQILATNTASTIVQRDANKYIKASTPAGKNDECLVNKGRLNAITEVNIPTSGWGTINSTTNLYSQDITVSNMYAEYVGTQDANYKIATGSTLAQIEAIEEAFSHIKYIVSGAGIITVYVDEIPTTQITLLLYGL